MQSQFTPPFCSSDSSGYLYNEPKPALWRRLLPLLVVLIAGTAACYGGLSAGKKMAGELTQLDTVQADPQLVQRIKIGEENPDLMMPQPTLAPPKIIAVVQQKPVRRAPRPTRSATSKVKPVSDPFADSSIPFQAAEDYTPGIEHEKPDALSSESGADSQQNTHSQNDQGVEATKSSEPEKLSAEESVPEDSASPVPVTE
jgi:hypothetical protein